MEWSWTSLGAILPDLLRGALNTILYTVAAFPLALLTGLALAAAEAAGPRLVSRIATGFIEFVRSTPLLVQIYCLYFMLPDLGLVLPTAFVGIGAVAIHYGCYISRVYLAGLRAVPVGQWDAAASLGLPRLVAFRTVIARQALLPIYPALANYLVTLIKETPLLSAIGIVEVMGAAKIAGAETFRYTEPFTAAGAIFLALTLVTVAALRWGERRIGDFGPR